MGRSLIVAIAVAVFVAIAAPAAVAALSATEGAQFSGTVTTAGCSVSGTAVIDWGDGTTSDGNTPPPGSSGPITGTHTYAEEGTYHGSVTYTDDCGPHNDPFDMAVSDAALTNPSGKSVSATPAAPFSGQVATFSDSDPAGTSSDYSATINWGDGSSSGGSISAVSGGFAVNASHGYTTPGSYTTTVSIADAGGASTVARGTATVTAITPAAQTSSPTTIGTTGATLAGTVNPHGQATTASFQYGLDSRYSGLGNGPTYTQSTAVQQVGSDASAHFISAPVSGLVPNAVYHVRLVASNSTGTTFGPDQTFTTKATPPPGAPKLGKSENVTPAGLVFVVIHGALVPLTEKTQLPAGTVLDALHGSVNLVAASGKKGQKYTGTFGGAVFKLTQTRSGRDQGLTTLQIVEGAFTGAPSYASCKAKGASDGRPAARIALSSRVLQTLRSRSSGRFRTRGRYAAATVRGTKWTTSDRCNGTAVRVQIHSVLVNDLVKHITVLITAGHSYLALAPTPKKHK